MKNLNWIRFFFSTQRSGILNESSQQNRLPQGHFSLTWANPPESITKCEVGRATIKSFYSWALFFIHFYPITTNKQLVALATNHIKVAGVKNFISNLLLNCDLSLEYRYICICINQPLRVYTNVCVVLFKR